MCTIQFVWRDSGYVYARTIRTWIRTPDMMRDVLNMVNFVVDSHSMSDALDTYDTIFMGRSSCSIDSSGSNKKHNPPPIQNPRYQIPEDRHAQCCSPPCKLLLSVRVSTPSRHPKTFRFRKFWRSYLDQNLLRITNLVSDLTGDQ